MATYSQWQRKVVAKAVGSIARSREGALQISCGTRHVAVAPEACVCLCVGLCRESVCALGPCAGLCRSLFVCFVVRAVLVGSVWVGLGRSVWVGLLRWSFLFLFVISPGRSTRWLVGPLQLRRLIARDGAGEEPTKDYSFLAFCRLL